MMWWEEMACWVGVGGIWATTLGPSRLEASYKTPLFPSRPVAQGRTFVKLGVGNMQRCTEHRDWGVWSADPPGAGDRGGTEAAGPEIWLLTSRGGCGLMVWKVVMKYRREMEVLKRKSQKYWLDGKGDRASLKEGLENKADVIFQK